MRPVRSCSGPAEEGEGSVQPVQSSDPGGILCRHGRCSLRSASPSMLLAVSIQLGPYGVPDELAAVSLRSSLPLITTAVGTMFGLFRSGERKSLGVFGHPHRAGAGRGGARSAT